MSEREVEDVENIFTMGAGTLLIGCAIFNFVLYHNIFRVTYFGSVGKSIINELIWCFIFACVEVAILIKAGQFIIKIAGIVIVGGVLIVGVYRAFKGGKEFIGLFKKNDQKNADDSILETGIENAISGSEGDASTIENKKMTDKKEKGTLKKVWGLIPGVVVAGLLIMAVTGKFDNFFHEISNGAYGKADNHKVTAVNANTDNELLQEIEQENTYTEGIENGGFDASAYKLYENVLTHALDMYGTGNKYTVCDIDADGMIELIVSHGSSDADWINDVYTIDGEEVIHIGWFNNYSNLYYSDMSVTNDGEGIISVTGRQGIESIDQIKKVGNQITVENVVHREVEDDLYYGNEMFIYSLPIEDMTLLLDTFIESQGW